MTGIDGLLARARARLRRVTPAEAAAAVRDEDALLVDIRPAAQRAEFGEVPGALIIERNVLEWRFDPLSETRLPQASYDRPVLLLCQESYASSLAAEALLDIGLPLATDVIGGFDAWRAAGLPATDPAAPA